VRIGITLPQFSDRADTAMAAARRAERLGLDGAFCFDHLWPIGHPGRPALSPAPLLGALAASTSTLTLGTLVARVGLVPDDLLVSQLGGLSVISGGRFIAGLGTGDALSRPENEAYGIPFEPADERRRRVAVVGSAVRALGVPVWVGGGSPRTIDLARHLGVAVNLWEGAPRQVADLVGSGLEVTWGGPVGTTADAVAAQLTEVAAAGATWAVCAWPESLEVVAEAAAMVRRASLADRPGPPA
jgi:alkanesulfonate monooxygenase SsuD/methylene tetrahydromethanopterin reductase-like flavin-dependent oxidoreductase (luciferase family)